MSEKSRMFLSSSGISNRRDSILAPASAIMPIISDKIFGATKWNTPKYRNGTSSHESNGPQYPLIASAKFPFRYFCAIEI